MNLSSTTISLEDIIVGMKASCRKTIRDQDIREFAKLSGDSNPIHLDEKIASSSRFKRRIAHGLLSASLFSSIFGTQLPGTGCVYVSQNLNFIRPVYIGDAVTATVSVIDILPKQRFVKFDTICTVRRKTVIDGTAILFLPQ